MSMRYQSDRCEVKRVEGPTVATVATCRRTVVYSAECWTAQWPTPELTVQATPPPLCRRVTCSALCEVHKQEFRVRGQIAMCTCMPTTGAVLQTLLGLLLNKCHFSLLVEGFKCYSLLFFALYKTSFKCNICRERAAHSCGVGSVSGKW